jgi:hypothetical protein
MPEFAGYLIFDVKKLEETMRSLLARCGTAWVVGGLLGCGAAQAWKVTTSNHNNSQYARVEADPSLYMLEWCRLTSHLKPNLT